MAKDNIVVNGGNPVEIEVNKGGASKRPSTDETMEQLSDHPRHDVLQALIPQFNELERLATVGKVAARDITSHLYNHVKHGHGLPHREIKACEQELKESIDGIVSLVNDLKVHGTPDAPKED